MRIISLILLHFLFLLNAFGQNLHIGTGEDCGRYNNALISDAIIEGLGDSIAFALFSSIQDSCIVNKKHNLLFVCKIDDEGEILSIVKIWFNENKIFTKEYTQAIIRYLKEKKRKFQVCYVYDPYDPDQELARECVCKYYKEKGYLIVMANFPGIDISKRHKENQATLYNSFGYLKKTVKDILKE